METIKENSWSKEAGYIWSMIGSAVGFANVLSFSALCYKNGGGAFLIPYVIAHLIIGIPLLILEGSVGQSLGLPLVSAMGKLGGRVGKFFGWLSILTCATIGGFYAVLTGFSVAYTYFTSSGMLSENSGFFFKHTFLKDSGALNCFGGISLGVLLATFFVISISWFVLSRKIQSGIEKLCSFFLPLLGVLVLLFSLATIFLPGASIGFKHYLFPDFHRLCDWTLWRDVFGQVFFSLSLGLGIVTGYSRHNPTHFNIPKAMVRVALGDFIISFVSGFAIFGAIGYLSHKLQLPFGQLVASDSAFEIGFVVFPSILLSFGPVVSKILGPLFFFCIFIAGITGLFSIIEAVAGNIESEFKKTRRQAVKIAIAVVSILAIPFCMSNGQHILGALAPMVLGNIMLLGGIFEIVLCLFINQSLDPSSFPLKMSSYSLKWIVLPLLILSLGGAIFQEFIPLRFDLALLVRWGWFLVCLLFATLLSLLKLRKKQLVV